MHRQRNFLLFVTLAAAAATPALAQTVTSGGRTGQQRNERRRIDPGLFPRLESPGLSLVRAAGIGSRPGDEQVALAAAARRRFRHGGPSSASSGRGRRERLRPAGRRLHQSDLAALGGGGREEVRRNVACGHHLREPFQPMLAHANAVHLQAIHGADHSAAGQGPAHLHRPESRTCAACA